MKSFKEFIREDISAVPWKRKTTHSSPYDRSRKEIPVDPSVYNVLRPSPFPKGWVHDSNAIIKANKYFKDLWPWVDKESATGLDPLPHPFTKQLPDDKTVEMPDAKKYTYRSRQDADDDGILDHSDPDPFDRTNPSYYTPYFNPTEAPTGIPELDRKQGYEDDPNTWPGGAPDRGPFGPGPQRRLKKLPPPEFEKPSYWPKDTSQQSQKNLEAPEEQKQTGEPKAEKPEFEEPSNWPKYTRQWKGEFHPQEQTAQEIIDELKAKKAEKAKKEYEEQDYQRQQRYEKEERTRQQIDHARDLQVSRRMRAELKAKRNLGDPAAPGTPYID